MGDATRDIRAIRRFSPVIRVHSCKFVVRDPQGLGKADLDRRTRGGCSERKISYRRETSPRRVFGLLDRTSSKFPKPFAENAELQGRQTFHFRFDLLNAHPQNLV